MVTAAPQHAVPDLAPASARWELLRALGAAVLTPPPGNVALCEALDLSLQTGAEHTHVFVLSAPPHAAIYLGPEGKLGGMGLCPYLSAPDPQRSPRSPPGVYANGRWLWRQPWGA